MTPYSQDLRERVIAAVEAGEYTQAEIADLYSLSQSTVEKWVRRKRDTGRVAAWPHASGPERTLQAWDEVIRREIKGQPDATLDELCARLAKAEGVSASSSMMCRELQHLGLARKKSRFTTANRKRRE